MEELTGRVVSGLKQGNGPWVTGDHTGCASVFMMKLMERTKKGRDKVRTEANYHHNMTSFKEKKRLI